MRRLLAVVGLCLLPLFLIGQGFTLKNPGYVASLPKAAAGGGGSPTEVDQISGLFAWYKPGALLTNAAGSTSIANGDQIIGWGDSSGNNRAIATNNPSALTPQWENSGTGSKAIGGIEFGTDEYLRVGFTAQADTTIFVVWRINSSGTYLAPMDGTNASGRQSVYKNNGNAFGVFSGTEATGGATVTGNWYIQAGVFSSSGNDSLYTNGVAVSTSLNSGSQSLDGLTVGAFQSGSNPPGNDSWVGEVVIYSRNLNSTEIGQVFTILNTRWSIY